MKLLLRVEGGASKMCSLSTCSLLQPLSFTNAPGVYCTASASCAPAGECEAGGDGGDLREVLRNKFETVPKASKREDGDGEDDALKCPCINEVSMRILLFVLW